MTFKTKTLQITALMILTTSIAPVFLMQAYSDDSSDRSQYYEEFEEPAISQSLASISSVNPCDTATQPAQCAYLPVGSLPNFADDTIESQGGDPASECGNALILSTGNPLNAALPGGVLSTSMGTPGCGSNPDGFGTFDCVDASITPEADSLVLAYSSEWKEYQFTSFTDWMRIGSIVDISINDWPDDTPFIPYGPDGTGTQSLATIAAGETVALRVADSGDSIYDTGLIVVPVACFEEPPPPLICGNSVVDEGEQCDDGNNVDGDGCSAICLLENSAPVCDAAEASIQSLWPPNHKLVDISIGGITDPDGDPLTLTVTSIFQDEPVNARGDGNTSPDAILSPAQVRAERSGTGDGRVYVITVEASDGSGGSCTGTVEVGVPHDVKDIPVNSGAIYDSTTS